ncbi:class I SAM-dependent methyltransferase [Propionibacteriaceae bacterium G57]|uniref:class I SAM-dependent methyltransferase n=1 Tax=Aestuariimicrobium sp. G57 TaxID=3418485 RepID=UPI003DA74029
MSTAAEFWEQRYADGPGVWSGRVNATLAQFAADLTPGTALDLGCGEGGDVIWLAGRGWQVTGVDLSPTAVARGRAAAGAAGIPDGAVRLEAADLATWVAPVTYDLVTASFLQSWPAELPRDEILHRATGFVAPGGHLLVVAHAEAPPWSNHHHQHGRIFPTPQGDLAALRLDPDEWQVLVCETRERQATGPDGNPAHLVDSVVFVRRVG